MLIFIKYIAIYLIINYIIYILIIKYKILFLHFKINSINSLLKKLKYK